MKLSYLASTIASTTDLADIDITGIFFDSRKVTKNSLFVCIKGESVDGHNYAINAENAGAAVIVAEHQTDSTLPHIIVDDARIALSKLSAIWFDNPQDKLKFIGITGTNGKTSTAFYVKRILDSMGKKTGMIGTVCNIICDKVYTASVTTPEPYALYSLLNKMVEAGVEYVVMEVSSHSLVQNRIFGITYETAVFTNLTQDHLDYHKTMENYKAAKALLFNVSKSAVINIDDATGKEYYDSVSCKKYSYSTLYNSADFVGKDIKIKPSGVNFLAVTLGGIARVGVSSPGGFTVYNALGAIGAVCALGFRFIDIIPHVLTLGGVDGRAQIISGERDYTVMIDYAHTPDGLKNILSSVKKYAKARVITLFGCGGDRDKTKRPIMAKVACEYSDYVVVTSDNPRTEDPMQIINDILVGITLPKSNYTVIENREMAIHHAIEQAKPDDIVVLAGKGHEKYQILKDGKIDFDEEAIAIRIMEQLQK